METFYIFLVDMDGNVNWSHPQELNGKSKDEIKKLLLEDIPPESIHCILTKEEFMAMRSGKGKTAAEAKVDMSTNIDIDNCKDTNDFFQKMIQAGNTVGSMNAANENNKYSNNMVPVKTENIVVGNTTQNINHLNTPPIYFTEGNIKFKLENNILYKQDWQSILDDSESKDQFRIINADSGKLINNEKYIIQKLEWVPVNSCKNNEN